MQCDVLIIGGGLVGASLAIALKDSNLSILIVESNSSQAMQAYDFDARSIALSEASKNILNGLGLWTQVAQVATAIETIHVSKKSQFGATLLDVRNYQKKAFGYVSEMGDLNQTVQSALNKQKNVRCLNPATLKTLVFKQGLTIADIEKENETIEITAKLVVAADGTHSFVRKLLEIEVVKEDYKQCAVVANIGLRRSHNQRAYERFTSTGLIALLPMRKQRAALVWATDPINAKRLYALSEEDFLNELQSEFGYRLGRFNKVGRRGSFPLQLQYMQKTVDNNIVFVGNSSQTLHPIAGQGFNLGLRDVAMLAELMLEEGILTPQNLLARFEKSRASDRKRTINSTNNLVKFFGFNLFPVYLIQTFGLMAVDLCSPLSEWLVKSAMGYSLTNSKLACNIPLRDPM